MAIDFIQPSDMFKPATYTPVVRVGPGHTTIYIAGQTSQDAAGQVVGAGDIRAQAVQVFENLKRALAAVGAGFDDLVKMNIYLTDPRFREPLAEVRGRYLTGRLPVSTLVTVAALAHPDYLLEIEVIAAK
ncbi:MAG: RidA family protein [Dehalococcoidia bacterium]|nr:RidA family protein [Dehalococcoidia bacterium]